MSLNSFILILYTRYTHGSQDYFQLHPQQRYLVRPLLNTSTKTWSGQLESNQHHLPGMESILPLNYDRFTLVPMEGLEPPLLSEADFESAASTDSATWAICGTTLQLTVRSPIRDQNRLDGSRTQFIKKVYCREICFESYLLSVVKFYLAGQAGIEPTLNLMRAS